MAAPHPEDSDEDAALAIWGSIPEPILLIAADGFVLRGNDRFASAFGHVIRPKSEKKLTDIFSNSTEFFQQALRDWLGTREPLPKIFQQSGQNGVSTSLRVEGWRTQYGDRAAVILRFFQGNPSIDRFIELTTLVDTLNNECARRARIEDELRSLLGQLNAVNNMRDLIMAQLSHDLRTPLNAVLGMSEFILSEPFGKMNPRYNDYVNDIKLSGEILLEQVNSALSMTEDTDILDRTKDLLADLSDCLDSCHRVASPIAQRRGIDLLVPTNIRAPRIRAEKTLVKQILMNLIGNATKHIEEGGHIKVDVDWQMGSDLNVSVIDDGPGIDPEKLEALLRSNSRDAYATNKTGFGMGLYLTSRSAEAIGARISIDSAPGKGTIATMTIPAAMLDMSTL
ncbi:MAG: hypothetical protein CMM78_01860 [Rhodospirillaceae bacterium]|jgi:signal transduction histidine kinase|uniref:sensor histidine kinase n=1 Tax=Hwanghaeella sp. 1Z406 TaxID=3402811 RepID=UPI000C4DF4EB|nr:hypothetical protein [Rhodospirillales bacterium]MAX46931.1 hypothetical protein [Rhodospirillaceae bacterium]|tara:strand:- start:365 stop:1552 length:1188 start_codon:yes stop_codon:yes gene_type:complete